MFIILVYLRPVYMGDELDIKSIEEGYEIFLNEYIVCITSSVQCKYIYLSFITSFVDK